MALSSTFLRRDVAERPRLNRASLGRQHGAQKYWFEQFPAVVAVCEDCIPFRYEKVTSKLKRPGSNEEETCISIHVCFIDPLINLAIVTPQQRTNTINCDISSIVGGGHLADAPIPRCSLRFGEEPAALAGKRQARSRSRKTSWRAQREPSEIIYECPHGKMCLALQAMMEAIPSIWREG